MQFTNALAVLRGQQAKTLTFVLCGFGALTAACSSTDGGDERVSAGGKGGSMVAPTPPNEGIHLPPRRLNRGELTNALRSNFGVTFKTTVGPQDGVSGTFDRDAQFFDIDADIASAYLDVAVQAARAVNPTTLTGCSATITKDCVRAYLEKNLSVLLRRPTTTADISSYLVTFDRGAARSGAPEGVREIVARVVASPDFLYVIETANGKGPESALTPHALATRLALAVWREPPDAALFAKANAMGSPEDLAAAVLGDARANEGLLAFHAQWLDLEASRKADLRAGAQKGIGAALEQSMHKWVLHSFAADAPLASLLAGEGLFTDAAINNLLSLPADTDAQTPVAKRAGLLLHPGFLAALAHEKETAPILRGAFVGLRVACADLVQPDLDLTAFPVDPSLPTTRARTAQQTSPGACSACHKIINPLGFAFEGYDHLGRPRTSDNGTPIDTSGTFAGLGVEGMFKGADDMLDQLLASQAARSCYGRNWLQYLLGRKITPDRSFDEQLTSAAAKPLAASGGVRTFLRRVLSSKAVTTIPVR